MKNYYVEFTYSIKCCGNVPDYEEPKIIKDFIMVLNKAEIRPAHVEQSMWYIEIKICYNLEIEGDTQESYEEEIFKFPAEHIKPILLTFFPKKMEIKLTEVSIKPLT